MSASLACTTGKKHFEAADKCVRSLIFCVRTSGKPYTLNDADFSSCIMAVPWYMAFRLLQFLAKRPGA